MDRKLLGKHGAALIIITVMVIAVLTAYKYTRAKTSLTAVVTSDGVTVLTLSLDEIAEKREFTLDNGIVCLLYTSLHPYLRKCKNGFLARLFL